jgi:hypothetical protein
MNLKVVISASVLSIAMLASCATLKTKTGTADIDWNSLESASKNSADMAFEPEIIPLDMTVRLLDVQDPTAGGEKSNGPKDIPVGPYGIYLGNGLAIDHRGSIFLDLVKLLKIDTERDFELRSGWTRLVRKGDDYRYFESSAVSYRITKPKSKKTLFTIEHMGKIDKKDNEYTYYSDSVLPLNYGMTVEDSSITIEPYTLSNPKTIIEIDDGTINLERYSLAGRVSQEITKSGDVYTIAMTGTDGKAEYKVYYAGNAIYFCLGNLILKKVEVLGDSVLVNGARSITYTHQ